MPKAHAYWELAADTVYPSRAAFAQAAKHKPLSIYLGIDPTGPILHLGHAVVLRVLRELQEQGHRIILLIGDFTAGVGDPSGRDTSRPMLEERELSDNLAKYQEQVFKLLDPQGTKFRRNSEWLDNVKDVGSLKQFLRLVGVHFTAAQLWERDMFQTRAKQGAPVTLTEFIYPVLQAYDFVALKADVQVGGTDQTFNMLAGRDLAKKMNAGDPSSPKATTGQDKFVITTKLLRGTDGRKMSKSYKNYIGVLDEPNDMYGKLMSVRDELIAEYFALAVGVDPDEPELRELIQNKPRDAKAKMAYEVIAFYHGAQAATQAEGQFTAQFRDGQAPTEMREVTPSVSTEAPLAFYLVDLGLAESKTVATRLIEQHGVRVDDVVIEDPRAVITPHDGMVINVGKRRYVRVKLT